MYDEGRWGGAARWQGCTVLFVSTSPAKERSTVDWVPVRHAHEPGSGHCFHKQAPACVAALAVTLLLHLCSRTRALLAALAVRL